jgi:3-isopropylmalate/(R)-2-methylmalate dehydratase small subunit
MGLVIPFSLDEFRRQTLLQGLDDIALTLRHIDDIGAYEERMREVV